MKYYNQKSAGFSKGKSFYFVVCLCLLAIGGAVWSAWSGVKGPETSELNNSSDITSYYSPETDTSSDAQVQGDASELYYSSEETSSTEEKTEEQELPVATTFAFPLNGDIGKSFSDSELKFSNTYKDMRYHEGVDITCDKGTSVKSCGNGTVVAVINDSLLGIYIEIDHGNSLVARYCGLSKNVLVSEGDTVTLGQKLGTVDLVPSECVDAAHLHLEMFKDSKSIDPLSVIESQE